MKNSLLLVISAPSGTGKTTLCEKLLERFPEIKFSVSATTRPPREGEKAGKDYLFLSEEEFRKKVDNGEMIEWA